MRSREKKGKYFLISTMNYNINTIKRRRRPDKPIVSLWYCTMYFAACGVVRLNTYHVRMSRSREYHTFGLPTTFTSHLKCMYVKGAYTLCKRTSLRRYYRGTEISFRTRVYSRRKTFGKIENSDAKIKFIMNRYRNIWYLSLSTQPL